MEHSTERRARFISAPYQRRYYFSWLLGGEDGYTSEEMQQRSTIRELRLASPLLEEVQDSRFEWFREDKQALINIYEDSWFFRACFKPRETLKSDSFASHLLRHDVVSWPELGKFVLELGDYLIIRNQNLPPEHYNQPMNYVLMDIRSILERLASIKDEQRLLLGLKPLRAYIAGIERLISPASGGDHIFLTDLRSSLYRQEKIFAARVSRQSIHRELEKIQHTIQNLAQQLHAMLHFSFARQLVNAHPHIEFLETDLLKENDLLLHPVSGAEKCIRDKVALQNCPFLRFPDKDKSLVVEAYQGSIGGLRALLDFSDLLEKALIMTTETGEVFSLFEMHQKCEPILRELGAIANTIVKDAYIVIEQSQEQYRLAVETMQASGRLSRWFGSAVPQAKAIIENQDVLALFKIDMDALSDSNEALQTALQRLHQHFTELNQERAQELVQQARTSVGDFFKSASNWQEKYHVLANAKAIAPTHPQLGLSSQSFLSSTAFPKPVSMPPKSSPTSSANSLNYSYALAIPLGILTIVLFLILVHRAYQYCSKNSKKEKRECAEARTP